MRQSSDRVPNSFGIAGHLGVDAEVLYQSVFTPKSAGRIADLIAAKLRPTAVHELRLRSIIEIVLFEAYWGQIDVPSTDPLVSEPLVLECGSDSKWIAVGAKFDAKNDVLSGPLATLANLLREVSDRVILKKDSSGRTELIAMIQFPSPSGSFRQEVQAEIEFIDLGGAPQKTPTVAQYRELGDLDYHHLLGEELALRSKETEGEALSRASWREAAPGAPSHVRGLPQNREEMMVVRGGDSEQDQEGYGRGGAGILGFFKKLVRPRRKVRLVEVPAEPRTLLPESEILAAHADSQDSKSSEAPEVYISPVLAPTELAKADAAPSAAEADLTRETTKLSQTIERIEVESKTIGVELKTDRAKRWMDGMVSELVAEKARIQEMLKRVSLLSRQKDLEFKNRERGYEEEIRRREELGRQRLGALNLSKDTIQNLQAEMQRIRAQVREQGSDTELRRKLEYSQSVLDRLREENDALKARARVARPSGADAKNQAETTVLRERNEKNQRMLEDFRRQNAQLIARLGEMERRTGTVGGRMEEMRNKIDQAASLLNDRKREIEALKKVVTDREVTEIKLKRRMAELESQVVILKKTGGKGGQAA